MAQILRTPDGRDVATAGYWSQGPGTTGALYSHIPRVAAYLTAPPNFRFTQDPLQGAGDSSCPNINFKSLPFSTASEAAALHSSPTFANMTHAGARALRRHACLVLEKPTVPPPSAVSHMLRNISHAQTLLLIHAPPSHIFRWEVERLEPRSFHERDTAHEVRDAALSRQRRAAVEGEASSLGDILVRLMCGAPLVEAPRDGVGGLGGNSLCGAQLCNGPVRANACDAISRYQVWIVPASACFLGVYCSSGPVDS